MTCNYSPTQQNRLCCLLSTAITRAWVVSFLTRPDTNKHRGVPLSHSSSVPLWCSACRALPIGGVELPSNIYRVPPWALLTALWQITLWRKGVVVQSEITFPLSSIFLLDEVKNESFWIWQECRIKSCIQLLWGKSHWKLSLEHKFTARYQGPVHHTQHRHLGYSKYFFASYTLEKAARRSQIIIGK